MRFRSLCAGCALALAPSLAWADPRLLGSHGWEPDWQGAGGFSALWLGPDGRAFAALSDRGQWVEGQLSRDADGAVSGVDVTGRGPLLHSSGERLRVSERDAEAIARTDDGYFLAYEGVHRVMRHPALGNAPDRIPQHPAFEGLQSNSGLEALAADAEGRLYAIPERSGQIARPFPVYRYEDGEWTIPFALRRDGPWLVTGADIGPDGRLYLLERDFALIGFRSRVRSFDLTGGDERLVIETPLRMHDNLESLSIWRDGNGRLRMTLLSDDNYSAFQRTEFVDYILSDPADPSPGDG
ncbi:esterase-like activity of phytase family protein [Jannaschia aquimarina]|uniref:Phytase-like domain-containing protein n=1 Tax=Jannaschia aquimarina TaxID=935700 RepID=A0A0D1EE63_9RHOB|nr:esterase-like activity of phytase family protein [Jannaschia aquimarina]KIT14200.1 hypothetical protein jaqu_39930 [Jannaschia aquimarina]SNS47996.1 hypothetical protein SAMN05421775_101113 [Jannaschia aquimarina]